MSIILAIDYGELKSGIAVSDESQVFAFGLATITTNNLIDYIENYNIKNNITQFVVGQPKRMNHEYSEVETLIREFIKKLSLRFPDTPIDRYDERFSSKMAFQTMIDAIVLRIQSKFNIISGNGGNLKENPNYSITCRGQLGRFLAFR